MRALGPANSRQQQHPVHSPSELIDCTHVFIRVGAKVGPLVRLYEGPHRVLQRVHRSCVIETRGNRETISIDSIKAAYTDCASNNTRRVFNTTSTCEAQPSPIIEDPVIVLSTEDPPSSPHQTKLGRRVHFSRRLAEWEACHAMKEVPFPVIPLSYIFHPIYVRILCLQNSCERKNSKNFSKTKNSVAVPRLIDSHACTWSVPEHSIFTYQDYSYLGLLPTILIPPQNLRKELLDPWNCGLTHLQFLIQYVLSGRSIAIQRTNGSCMTYEDYVI